jgi:hypothetical protein
MRTVGTSIYLGIDPTVGRAQFVYAALDEDGKIEALGSGKLNAVLAYAAGQSQAWIAVNGPRGVNQGLTDAANTQQALFNEPGNAAWNNLRLAEAELIARGLEKHPHRSYTRAMQSVDAHRLRALPSVSAPGLPAPDRYQHRTRPDRGAG